MLILETQYIILEIKKKKMNGLLKLRLLVRICFEIEMQCYSADIFLFGALDMTLE